MSGTILIAVGAASVLFASVLLVAVAQSPAQQAAGGDGQHGLDGLEAAVSGVQPGG